MEPAGVSHPVVTLIRRLLDKGRTWVKLSVSYDNTAQWAPGPKTRHRILGVNPEALYSFTKS